jgi:hypothetical protein
MCASAQSQTGLSISGDDGIASEGAVSIRWHYDEPTLTITPVSLVAKLGAGQIEAKVRKLISDTAIHCTA